MSGVCDICGRPEASEKQLGDTASGVSHDSRFCYGYIWEGDECRPPGGWRVAYLALRGGDGELRLNLFLRHGHDGPALYGDDGEMQCKLCGCDYRRAPIAECVGRAFAALDLRAARALVSAALQREALVRMSHFWSDAGPGMLARLDLIDQETKEVVKRAMADEYAERLLSAADRLAAVVEGWVAAANKRLYEVQPGRGASRARAVPEGEGEVVRKKQNKQPVRLFACGTAWGWEVDRSNSHHLPFYCTKEALLDDVSCAESCGVVEVEVRERRWAVKPDVERFRRGLVSGEVVEREQLAYIKLADELLAFARSRTKKTRHVQSAFTWVLGKLKKEARRKRRRARERRERSRGRK